MELHSIAQFSVQRKIINHLHKFQILIIPIQSESQDLPIMLTLAKLKAQYTSDRRDRENVCVSVIADLHSTTMLLYFI